MPHRDAALGQFANALDPLRSDRPAYPICISRPTGAGDTVVSRFAVHELRRETVVKTAHVDCLRTRSHAAILEEALVDAGLKTRSSPKADAASSYLAQLEDADSPIVLTLDEAEHIEDEHLPHVLFEANGVAPVFVVHEHERFVTRLDAETSSRFRTGLHIELKRYSQSELVDILQSRVDAGDLSGITDGTLELIADVRELAMESIRRYNMECQDTPHRLLKHMIDYPGEIWAEELVDLFGVEYSPHQLRAGLITTHRDAGTCARSSATAATSARRFWERTTTKHRSARGCADGAISSLLSYELPRNTD
ncbi:hypothetical protein [Halobaculum marinum]|uniref:Cdc6-related protein, AAA superfamily ATPase n=1 Tax=Halobaculum marinum TaxID=3031996 RepID=A0ABD5WR15_9EURY|nr:hypothetical protein [Halobaculum sp. DT55]